MGDTSRVHIVALKFSCSISRCDVKECLGVFVFKKTVRREKNFFLLFHAVISSNHDSDETQFEFFYSVILVRWRREAVGSFTLELCKCALSFEKHYGKIITGKFMIK